MERAETNSLLKSCKVLIVDDLASARRVVRRMMERLGCADVIEAEDGRDALDLLEKRTVQLIICDNSMKDMCGLELLKTVKQSEELRGIPFVMLSSFQEQRMVEEAKAAGASVYIVKPLSIKMLAEKVTQVLADAQAAADLDRLIET